MLSAKTKNVTGIKTKIRKTFLKIREDFRTFFILSKCFWLLKNCELTIFDCEKMKVTIEFCGSFFAKFLWMQLNFCGYPFARKIQFVYTQQSAQVGIQREKISIWHTILRHAKSSVLYLCSVGGEKDVCRLT